METILELWDEETAHLINTYPSASAALAVVAATIDEHGRAAVENWISLRTAQAGSAKETVAEGDALAHMALGAVHHPTATATHD
ncbi:MAG: hypothetical protein ACR2M3_20745 [Thermomicrobiales bacterium]